MTLRQSLNSLYVRRRAMLYVPMHSEKMLDKLSSMNVSFDDSFGINDVAGG